MNRLKPININRVGNQTIISFSASNVIAFEDEDEVLLDILLLLKRGNSNKEIIKELKIKNENFLESDYYFILDEVIKKEKVYQDEIINSILSDFDLDKYSRQLNLYQRDKNIGINEAINIQKNLKDSHVLLLGVGGVGSHVAVSLVSMGIGEITLVDFDQVELSNTTRQSLFNEEDIGKCKVEEAKDKLQKYNKNCVINIINKEVKKEEDLEEIISKINKVNFIVSTLDTPRGKIRPIIDKVLYEKEIVYMYNCSIGFDVCVGPMILKGETSSYSDYIKTDEMHDKIIEFNNMKDISNVYEPLNALAAQYTVNEVFKYISKLGNLAFLGKELIIDTQNVEHKWINLEDE